MPKFDLLDVHNIEDGADDEERYLSLQRAINGGMWGLQGSYGRAMMAAINAGYCMCGPQPARDAYGNMVPSRTMLQDGTKGTRQFIVDNHGEEWAAMMEAA